MIPGASLLHFTRESYKVAHKEQFHTINTTFCLYVYKRFRKNQHQNINKNSWYSEYEWTTFQYFVNLLPQMFIVIKKVKKSVYNSYWKEERPVAQRFFPHYIVNSLPTHSLEDGRKESFERAPCTRKWAKFLRAQYKGCLKSRCIIIKSDNRTIASYFLLLTLTSVALDNIVKGKVATKFFWVWYLY